MQVMERWAAFGPYLPGSDPIFRHLPMPAKAAHSPPFFKKYDFGAVNVYGTPAAFS